MCQRVHYTKIGDAGGVPLQRCEPSECGSAHYTKIGDAGVRRRGILSNLFSQGIISNISWYGNVTRVTEM